LNILFPEAEMDQSKDELMADIIRYMKTGNMRERQKQSIGRGLRD
jgi:hypothetical protein